MKVIRGNFTPSLTKETLPDPGTGDDHGTLPLRVCDDRVPALPEPTGNRRNGDLPDEEAHPEPDPEVAVLPLPWSPETVVPGRGDVDGDCHEYDPGIVEDTQAVREGIWKLLRMERRLAECGVTLIAPGIGLMRVRFRVDSSSANLLYLSICRKSFGLCIC